MATTYELRIIKLTENRAVEEDLGSMVLTTERGVTCTECEWASDSDDDLEPKYECGSCGSEFMRSSSADGDSHRCPFCNKFGSKVSENACPDCEQETMAADVFECPICHEWVEVSGLSSHIESCFS